MGEEVNKSMKKWEYKVFVECNEEILNKLGRKGWEVAGVYVYDTTNDGVDSSLILKREI